MPNGFEAILVPAEIEESVVALAVYAGVNAEPEGKQGVAHLTEHLFYHGGPSLGEPAMRQNAETMWAMTYYYAVRAPADVPAALEALAARLAGAEFTPALLDRERPKVLQEIEFAGAQPFRRPKAGVREHVEALTIADVEAFRANHYRPDRALLLVMGPIDGVRAHVERLFAPLRSRPSIPQSDARSPWMTLEYACPSAGARVAAWAWRRLQKGRAFVEWLPPGRVRLVLEGNDPTPLLQTRNDLYHPMGRADLGRALADATEFARARSASPPGPQGAIDRLILEVEGGKAFLDEAEKLTPDDVAASALSYFRDPEPDAVSGASPGPPPEPEPEMRLSLKIAIGASSAMLLAALVIRVRKHLAAR